MSIWRIAAAGALAAGITGFLVHPVPAANTRIQNAGARTGAYAGLQCDDPSLSPSQRAGCLIWFYATAGNGRFHTYVFQQRMNVFIDWFRVLNSQERADRFKAWGLINDPGCCVPGSASCPAKSYDETYGFDWCPGDETLLKFVGKAGYRDPACDFPDAPFPTGGPHGSKDQRESPCGLEFGTSAGAMGLRKFPNPRFDPERWRKLNGSLGTWKGYNAELPGDPDGMRRSRLLDGSVEPPFLIGMSCGACHISFDPLNPPKDPTTPALANIKGAVGAQYGRFSEIMASGMARNSLPWQVFAHARPGTVDTSAVPTDGVNNPGTMNAIFNFDKRPTFGEEKISKWRPISQCPSGSKDSACWCEPGRDGKCWEKSEKTERVHHILKGGEDSIGIREAVQRVYFNIGSCSETCWVNHLTDRRQVDPFGRNFGQTPFDIGQCRRDCPNFRAIEDRLGDVVNFLLVQRPADLHVARGLANRQDLVEQLNAEFGSNAVNRGRSIFAENCARCHSSQTDNLATRDFHKVDENGVRVDWLGNDQSTPVSEVGTYRSRALHSNHMAGRVWQEYGSETLRARKVDPNVPDESSGGRGYYRNISLLSAWATAPFMHNNAIGPEICGKPANKNNDFYSSPYVDAKGAPLGNPPPCLEYDPSVRGRYELYKASMHELLNPRQRIPKMATLDRDIPVDIGPKIWDEKQKKKVGVRVVISKGLPVATVGNLRYKALVNDLVLSQTGYDQLKARVGDSDAAELKKLADRAFSNPTKVLTIVREHMPLLERRYTTSTAKIENEGHRFGEDLSDTDKKALIAFVATL
jgi:hypothetical protein